MSIEHMFCFICSEQCKKNHFVAHKLCLFSSVFKKTLPLLLKIVGAVT